MIACPPGWSSESISGGLILRSPPRASSVPAAELRYREAVQPVLSAAALVSGVLSHQPDFRAAQLSLPELCITAEGEYAALVRVSGDQGGQPIWHLIGAVYGEDRMSVLDTTVRDPAALPEIGQIVRGLLYAERLGLGVRKRRFLYQPPTHWQPLPSGLLCSWYPPDYPRQPATLVVHPAMPRDSSEEAVFLTFIKAYQRRGFLVEAATDGIPVTTDNGLHGQAFCLGGHFPGKPELTCDLLVLADSRYLYSMILESGVQARRSELRQVLPAVARSIRAIPPPAVLAPSGRPSGPPSSLNYWSF